MIHLEKVNGKNVWEITKLRVSEPQKCFVAANDVSIVEAYITITANGFAFPFGIYDGEIPVGFIMIGYDVDARCKNADRLFGIRYLYRRLLP